MDVFQDQFIPYDPVRRRGFEGRTGVHQVDIVIVETRNVQRRARESELVAATNVSKATALCSISSIACQRHIA